MVKCNCVPTVGTVPKGRPGAMGNRVHKVKSVAMPMEETALEMADKDAQEDKEVLGELEAQEEILVK